MPLELTITEYLVERGFKVSFKASAKVNPEFPGKPAWRVTFRWEGRQMGVTFYSNFMNSDPIRVGADVMDCLLSDAAGFENARDFEDWASEYGYDDDSRRAHRIYVAVERQTAKLKAFLEDDYAFALWNVQRM